MWWTNQRDDDLDFSVETDDKNVMDRLNNIQPLPRGERIARYMATFPDANKECRRRWFKLVYRSAIIGTLFDAWLDDDAEDLVKKWGQYAKPLRDFREKTRKG